MTEQAHHDHALTLSDYLRVVRRRKWIILTATVVVPAAAIALSLHQPKLYKAKAEVLLQTQNLAAQLANAGQGSSGGGSHSSSDQTQAYLARVSEIARRVLQRVPNSGLTTGGFLANSSVSLEQNANLLTFTVTNRRPQLANRLVNTYAAIYVRYRHQLDTASIKKALSSVTSRLAQLKKARQGQSALYATLVERQQTLETMEALQTANASVVQSSTNASLIKQNTNRDGALALVLGLVLGFGLAFLRESLDTQVRSADEIRQRLGNVPLLGRLPAPPKRFLDQWHLAMVEEPYGPHAEVFRILRTNLDFVSLGRDVRTIMITSALDKEGKSTTIANLAVALARAGKRVVLVDLDLRRPTLQRLFGLEEKGGARESDTRPGVTQVALGYASLEEALVPIALTDTSVHAVNGNGKGQRTVSGFLELLPSGSLPPDPGEFVSTAALAHVLASLRERADLVLVDSPPTLAFGDALALSARMDGIILAAKIKVARRNILHELARQVATVPTPVLGVVITGAERESAGYGYGYGSSYGYGPRPATTAERAPAAEVDS